MSRDCLVLVKSNSWTGICGTRTTVWWLPVRMVRLNLIWSLFFSCSFLPLVNARWLTFSSTYAFLNLITRWEKLPGKGKIFLDSKINILEEWKIRNRDCTVKKKSDKLTRIITWWLTFCDSGIDERIIFDYIFLATWCRFLILNI